MPKRLRPKPTPTPQFKDAQPQYRAFAFLVHICNWTRSEAYTACFPNTVATGQSLYNTSLRLWNREEIRAIIEEIDLYEVQSHINAKVALMEKNTNSFAFAKAKPIATDTHNADTSAMLSMSDDELMNNAVRLHQAATNADEQLAAMKLITDLKKKLGTGAENEETTNVIKYYIPISCKACELYEAQKVILQNIDNQ